MSGLVYLEIDHIIGWVPEETDSEMEFSTQDVHKGVFLRSTSEEGGRDIGWGWVGNRAGMGREREVRLRWRSNNNLVQLQGSSGSRMTFQSLSKLGPDGLAFNFPYCSVFEYGPHKSQGNPWRGWQLKAVCWKHSQELGQHILFWRSNWAVYHNIHHRP